VTTTTAATCENERKRGGGAGLEVGGPVHCAKIGRGECTTVPNDLITGGARGSDERGDRTAGEGQNGGQTEAEWRADDERDETETERTRGENVLR
jgi:hypothetical protein